MSHSVWDISGCSLLSGGAADPHSWCPMMVIFLFAAAWVTSGLNQMFCHLPGFWEVPEHMEVSENGGNPNCLVYNRKTIYKWMIWGYPYGLGNPYDFQSCLWMFVPGSCISWCWGATGQENPDFYAICPLFAHGSNGLLPYDLDKSQQSVSCLENHLVDKAMSYVSES